jgi:hypothetical protein
MTKLFAKAFAVVLIAGLAGACATPPAQAPKVVKG